MNHSARITDEHKTHVQKSHGHSFVYRLGRFIKFSHTIFALPFALMALIVADPTPLVHPYLLFWVLVCMVSARSSAMAFNRLVDWELDKQNPRTAYRSTLVSKNAARWVVLLSSVLFTMAASQLNTLCLILSPLALAIVFFYSYAKRWTHYSHFFIGLALSIAPMGAWIAAQGTFSLSDKDGILIALGNLYITRISMHALIPLSLALATLLWVFGFDLIYAISDIEFDRRMKLHSFAARYGAPASLRLSLILHFLAIVALAFFGYLANLGWPYWCGWLIALIGLWIEQTWARSGDELKIQRAFFEVNGFVSLALLIGTALSDLV